MNKREELKAMLAAVDRLALEMKKKLREKAREGYSGGLDRNNRCSVAKKRQEHAERLTGVCPHCQSHDGEHDHEEGARQAVDVCNLALMLWVIEGSP
jgi:hypothetical protein